MLLRVFRSNNPSALFYLAIVVPVILATGWADPGISNAQVGMPLYDLLIKPIMGIAWLSNLLFALLVILCAVQLATLFNKLGFLDKDTQLPALFFILFSCSALSEQGLSPLICGLPFSLVAFRRSWNTSADNKTLSTHFDAGLLVGIASLFYLPFLFLLPAIWVGMAFMRTFRWREWLFPVLGIALVFMITRSIYFVVGSELVIPDPWSATSDLNIQDIPWPHLIFWIYSSLLLLWSLYWLVDIFRHGKVRRKNLMKAAAVAFVFLMALFVSSFFGTDVFGLVILGIPASVLCTYLFHGLYEKKLWLANTLFYFWLIILLFALWSERMAIQG